MFVDAMKFALIMFDSNRKLTKGGFGLTNGGFAHTVAVR